MTELEPDPRRDIEARAAEYVLGTLTAHEARAAAADPALAPAIAAWERRLAPLARLATPESPPPDLWTRIERQVAPRPQRSVGARLPWRTWLARGWTVGATGAALAMAAVLLLQSAEQPPLMTVMVADRTEPAWSALVASDGVLRLAAITPAAGTQATPTPDDRVLQLWALPPGATAPTSLALLPRDSRVLTLPAPAVRPVPGMLIEITLEPRGGSTIGRPTGPVLFIGRLSQPGPNT